MSAGFWMDLQLRWDLYPTHEQDHKDLESIKPQPAATSH
jgi:plasmid maintenance system antidote protein VapI